MRILLPTILVGAGHLLPLTALMAWLSGRGSPHPDEAPWKHGAADWLRQSKQVAEVTIPVAARLEQGSR